MKIELFVREKTDSKLYLKFNSSERKLVEEERKEAREISPL